MANGIIINVQTKVTIRQIAKNAYSAHKKQDSKNFLILFLFSNQYIIFKKIDMIDFKGIKEI